MPKACALSPSVKSALAEAVRDAFSGNESYPARFVGALTFPDGVRFEMERSRVVLCVYPGKLSGKNVDAFNAYVLEQSSFTWSGSPHGSSWRLVIQRSDFMNFMGCAIAGWHGKQFMSGAKMGFWRALRASLSGGRADVAFTAKAA